MSSSMDQQGMTSRPPAAWPGCPSEPRHNRRPDRQSVGQSQPILQLQETAQERLFRAGEQRHVNCALAAAQESAKLTTEIVSRRISSARVVQLFRTGQKLRHRHAPNRSMWRAVASIFAAPGKSQLGCQAHFQVRFPWIPSGEACRVGSCSSEWNPAASHPRCMSEPARTAL